jgi:hypothetical protein
MRGSGSGEAASGGPPDPGPRVHPSPDDYGPAPVIEKVVITNLVTPLGASRVLSCRLREELEAERSKGF